MSFGDWMDTTYSDWAWDYGYKEGFELGIEIAKRHTIYGDCFDDYISKNDVDVPNNMYNYSKHYENGYIEGYENGYKKTYNIHKELFLELNNNINLKYVEDLLNINYPSFFEPSLIEDIKILLC